MSTLGPCAIYIQATRWEGTVGGPEIQKFVGALHGKRAGKGVFITNGVCSTEAMDCVSRIDPRVVLVDGRELAEYMLDLKLSVALRATYELTRIDSDYVVEDRPAPAPMLPNEALYLPMRPDLRWQA